MSTVEVVPIDSIFPYEKNPRKIGQDAVNAVVESLRDFGWQQPIVVDKKNIIVVGHTRLLAAQILGYKKVPVLVANLTEEQARAYRIIDNKSGEKSLWDFEALREELSKLDMSKIIFEANFTPFELDMIFENEWQTDLDKVKDKPETGGVPKAKVVLECHSADKVDLEKWVAEIITDAPVEVAIKK